MEWSQNEIEELVLVYLSILEKDENGEVFDKDEIIFRFRQGLLQHRSQHSIEKRMCNISSVLNKNQTNYFAEYEPIGDPDSTIILMILESLRKYYPASLQSERRHLSDNLDSNINPNTSIEEVNVSQFFVQPSALKWAIYYGMTNELDVCFSSGDVFRYADVPRELIHAFYGATAIDDFFYGKIAYAFTYQIVPQSYVEEPERATDTSVKPVDVASKEVVPIENGPVVSFSTDLTKYLFFRSYVADYCARGVDMKTLNTYLKKDPECSKLRSAARSEFQSIYNAVAKKLGLPKVSVFLPTRKKVRVRGIARTVSGTPTEIRIYCIHGPSGKEYTSWSSSDMTIDDNCCVCETLVHEIAHIYEAHFDATLSHDETFIKGYLATEEVFHELGFKDLLLQENRFVGCPRDSKAAQLAGSPK